MTEKAKDTIKSNADQYLKSDSDKNATDYSNPNRFNERQPTSDGFNKTYEPFNKNLDK